MPYDSREQFEIRLLDSVIRYQGQPFYVLDVGSSRVSGDFIRDPEERTSSIRVDGDDPELDVSSPPLGHCVVRGDLTYLRRRATSTRKQGLCSNNVERINLRTGAVDSYRVTPSARSLRDCINGVYQLPSGSPFRVLDRHYAICDFDPGFSHLYYRGTRIAFSEDGGETFVLPSPYQFYREQINETHPEVRIA